MASLPFPPVSLGLPPADYRVLAEEPRVHVRHPGYEEGENQLISFAATDGAPDAPAVQYLLAHTVCAILAGNVFDGWLSRARVCNDIASRITEENSDGLLPAGIYYFHVPSEPVSQQQEQQPSHPYPIVPNFREWTFPHDNLFERAILPPSWQGPSIPRDQRLQGARTRDSSCRLTGWSGITEIAHIIPSSEREWASANDMKRYLLSTTPAVKEVVQANENLVLFRPDVHMQWDRREFSIIPARAGATGEDGWTWVVHVNVPSQELHYVFHNHKLHLLTGVQREFLFARLAWDFFPEIHRFLQRRKPRWLRLSDGTVSECSPKQCDEYCQGQGQFRSSSSPAKRLRQQENRPLPTRVLGGNDRLSFDSAIALSSVGRSSFSASDEKLYSTANASVQQDRPAGGEDLFGGVEEEEEDDPHGFKRRREVFMNTFELEADDDDEPLRGRKRWRL